MSKPRTTKTGLHVPVMKRDSLDARKDTRLAMSSVDPKWPTGMLDS